LRRHLLLDAIFGFVRARRRRRGSLTTRRRAGAGRSGARLYKGNRSDEGARVIIYRNVRPDRNETDGPAVGRSSRACFHLSMSIRTD
jgi:hypothetical protein